MKWGLLVIIAAVLGMLFLIVFAVFVLVTSPALLVWLATFVIIIFAFILILKAAFGRRLMQTAYSYARAQDMIARGKFLIVSNPSLQ